VFILNNFIIKFLVILESLNNSLAGVMPDGLELAHCDTSRMTAAQQSKLFNKKINLYPACQCATREL